MNIYRLEWDSDFFGLRIGRADIQTKEDSEKLSSMINEIKKDFDLVYVFDENHFGFNAFGASLVDRKVLYRKQCENKSGADGEVIMYKEEKPSDALYHLAHVSGCFSRFHIDKKFPKGSFERLYNRWIENSCPTNDSNKQIFIYGLKDAPKGMITINYDGGGIAHIGLVSVDVEYQNMGVGTKILNEVEAYLYRQGTVHSLEVPTQISNINACRWYEKNGFISESIIDIYHWWL